MDYILGVDLGTTSTKVLSFNLRGQAQERQSVEYPIFNPFPTYSEQDPEEIFAAVLKSIQTVVGKHYKREDKLLGIAFSSAMHSVIAVDEAGEKLTDCIIWADTRSKDYSDRLKGTELGHRIYLKTGTPIHPMSPLCKLAWMKEQQKFIFQTAAKFISIKEYVFFKLFGMYVVDYSIASSTGLFDIYRLTWNHEALNYLGISDEKLSVPVPTTHIMRGLKKEYAELLNIDRDTPFIVGASDGCLANLGTNAIKPGYAAVTIGTSGAIRVVTAKPVVDEQERVFNYILTKDRYVTGGSVNNGGIALRWFRDNFSVAELIKAEQTGADPYDLLVREAEEIPPGADGLIFLPYLLGERAPHWDANARGVFFGVNIKHTRLHFLRAVLEGVIYGLYSVGKAFEETTGKIQTIYATGGFARSALWLQLLADVFNTKVSVAESYENSCLGAAVMAMQALGEIAELEEVERLIPLSGTFEPDRAKHEIYAKNFEIFNRLYGKLQDEFHQG